LAEGNEIEDHELMDFLECVTKKDVEISKIPMAGEEKSKAWMNVANVLVPSLSAFIPLGDCFSAVSVGGETSTHCRYRRILYSFSTEVAVCYRG
jgi:hypothetical protein